ncbi:MAG: hypothetical protein NZ737_03670 [Candidatus Poseidoniaceae archaeon]|nr:hypothetical protein [Candidatus Poseidoniaceae archaeon]
MGLPAQVMRRHVTVCLILLLMGIAPTSSASFSSDPIASFSGSFDNTSELTSISITVTQTNDADFLDQIKQSSWKILRNSSQVGDVFSLCTLEMLNSECASNIVNITITPPPGFSGQAIYDLVGTLSDGTVYAGGTIQINENTSEVLAPESLTAVYDPTNQVTNLGWTIPSGTPAGYHIAIYRHASPASGATWQTMTKEMITNSLSEGVTSYAVDHSSTSVEEAVYYSVTLQYPMAEDTRFSGTNTLDAPVLEDNIAPLFYGELSATFDPDASTTLLDWGEGVSDSGLVINIYRSSIILEEVDSTMQVATVDASLSMHEVMIPFGEHRQSWYTVTLEDEVGNEVLAITPSSPSAGPIIETTYSPTTVNSVEAERLGDGTITVSWQDSTGNPAATAKIWRSISGPIDSLQDIEEVGSTNVGSLSFNHLPPDALDSVWYAVSIEGKWGSETLHWHDETMTAGVNSMTTSISELAPPEDEVVETNLTIEVWGLDNNWHMIGDGGSYNLNGMINGSQILIRTSEDVENLTHGTFGDMETASTLGGPRLYFIGVSEDRVIGVSVYDDGQEVHFMRLSVSVIEDTGNLGEDSGDEIDGHAPEEERTIAVYIIGVLMIVLFGYLMVMMRDPSSALREEE